MTPHIRRFATLAVISCFVAACALFEVWDHVQFDGTVDFQTLEGGCWSIIATDSTRYHPLPLPDAYKVPGTAVRVFARIRDDFRGYCPGRFIQIIDIDPL